MWVGIDLRDGASAGFFLEYMTSVFIEMSVTN